MKVKELIRELKKMPQNMQVGMAMQDNSQGEIADWVSSVSEEEEIDSQNRKKTGREVVVIRG